MQTCKKVLGESVGVENAKKEKRVMKWNGKNYVGRYQNQFGLKILKILPKKLWENTWWKNYMIKMWQFTST